LRRPGAGRIYFHLAVNISIILVYNLPTVVLWTVIVVVIV
jgi:hypothetical protein